MNENIDASFLGFAIGDALGVPVEFIDRNSLRKNPVNKMMGYGTHKVPVGTWSDDTSLTIATIDSLLEKGIIDYNDIMNKFSEWYDYAKYTATDRLFDVGIATSKAILNYSQYNIEPLQCGSNNIRNNGNGSLMRILPIVLYCYYNNLTDEETVSVINQSSSLTHSHEISMVGCMIYCNFIKGLLNGYDKYDALKMMSNFDYSKYYSDDSISCYDRILNGDIKNLSIFDIKSTGYVVYTLEACIWTILMNDNFKDSLLTAVNLGGDTDTIGAITGSIAGMIYGRQQIPEIWLEQLKKNDYLEKLILEFKKKLLHESDIKCAKK